MGKGQMMSFSTVGRFTKRNTVNALVGIGLVFSLAACDESGQMTLFQAKPQAAGDEPATASKSVRLIERDTEAPDVFSATEAGLWDGRPSLGGVWVAHPDVKDPERVIIRNTANGKFVIGALFRRERDNPGPRLQVSSDAAAALGLLAGQPMKLNVTALRREEVPDPAAAPATKAPAASTAPAVPAAATVTASALPPANGAASTTATAAAAIAKAETAAAPAAAPTTAPSKPKGGLGKPYLQIGIFSVQSNADDTAAKMRGAGMVPIVKKQTSQGKTFWRVLVGPAGSASERSALLKQIKAQGFADAYAVTN